jgi:hypothetical protein
VFTQCNTLSDLVYHCPANPCAIHRVRLTIYAYVMSISPRLVQHICRTRYAWARKSQREKEKPVCGL